MPADLDRRFHPDDRFLRWIAGFNLFKGLILLGFAVGILEFLHKDVDTIVANWMSLLRMDLENPHIAALLQRLDLVTDWQIKELSGLTTVYAGLFLTEGTGLLLRQRWAKYFTAIVTGSFIPFELYETLLRFGWVKLALLAANIGIVGYLVANLRKDIAQQKFSRAPVERSKAGPGMPIPEVAEP